MSEWYYAHGGNQKGPVPVSELQRLAQNGEFDPGKDLVWREGMDDWKPADTIPELQSMAQPRAAASPEGTTPADDPTPAPTAAPGDPINPYAAPAASGQDAPLTSATGWEEIPHGSQPIDVGGCISRGFELTKRHFGIIIATGAIYFGIYLGMSLISGVVDSAVGIETQQDPFSTRSDQFDEPTFATNVSPGAIVISSITSIASQIVLTFLGLGVTRIGLNIVTGVPATPGMIFGEASKLLRSVGAGILYGLMVGIGLLLLIVPGIYLAIRFGQYQNAIVDRDMGVFESFSYSSSITTNNRMSLLGLGILSFLIVVAGALALLVGLIFAYPIVWLAGLVAYRWMQHGPTVVLDRS